MKLGSLFDGSGTCPMDDRKIAAMHREYGRLSGLTCKKCNA